MRAVLALLRSQPKSAITVAALAFMVGAYLFLDWNTERRWQQYRSEAMARGVKFTLEEFVTPQNPGRAKFGRSSDVADAAAPPVNVALHFTLSPFVAPSLNPKS